MLEGITVALQSYYDTATSAKGILESAMEQIKTNYIGATLAEKTKEVQDAYNDTMKESRETNYSACVEILENIRSQVKQFVETPVPSEFISTLETMKQIKDPTEKEIEAVIGSYKNNYFAYRAICEYLGGVSKGFIVTTIDDIEGEIDYIRSNLHDCFYSNNIEGYHFRNWKDGTILSNKDEIIRAFAEGRFEDVHLHSGDGGSEF